MQCQSSAFVAIPNDQLPNQPKEERRARNAPRSEGQPDKWDLDATDTDHGNRGAQKKENGLPEPRFEIFRPFHNVPATPQN
jgi:hypothetical protein